MFSWFKKRDFVLRIIQSLKINKDWDALIGWDDVVRLTHKKCDIKISSGLKGDWILLFSHNEEIHLTFIEDWALHKAVRPFKRSLKHGHKVSKEKAQKQIQNSILECKEL